MAFIIDTGTNGHVDLANDTGVSSTDHITNDATLQFDTEPGDTVEYSLDGGNTWSTTFNPVEGENTVEIRYIDIASNEIHEDFSFVWDTIANAPTVTLKNDNGTNKKDFKTSDDRLTGQAESGATVTVVITDSRGTVVFEGTTEANGSGKWDLDPSAKLKDDATYSVKVSQTDIAGNVSAPSAAMKFVYDDDAKDNNKKNDCDDKKKDNDCKDDRDDKKDNDKKKDNDCKDDRDDKKDSHDSKDNDCRDDRNDKHDSHDKTLEGTKGNDTLKLTSADTHVDGGAGFDLVKVTASKLVLNFDNLDNVEAIDLGDKLGNTLRISLDDVLDVSNDTLRVLGDKTDIIKLDKDDRFTHKSGDTKTIDGVKFDVWHASDHGDVATLLLEQGMQVQMV
jgi:hypothetical protein